MPLVLFIIIFLGLLSPAIGAQRVPTGGLWVTFELGTERFQAVITGKKATEYVMAFAKGRAPVVALHGVVVQGGTFNASWQWHLEPSSIAFGEDTVAKCVSISDLIESEKPRSTCLRGARITRVLDCRSGRCVVVRGLYSGRSPAAAVSG